MKREELVQRFLDQELTADERVQFVVAVGRDASLRDDVLELERLVSDAARLARPAVPGGFVARVVESSMAPPAAASGPWRRLIAALWVPRVLEWNVASAAAVACVALIAIGGVFSIIVQRQASAAGTLATSAADQPVVLVRLVVVRPGARVVQAAGDFNGWNPTETPLEQTSDGAWTVTLPLEPGRYEYQFVVDGDQWIGDPFASEQSDDGFGSRNAVLDVRPPDGTPL
jgi:hypothetical protein